MYLASILLAVFFILMPTAIQAGDPTAYRNPILPGGYPDPSICRDGDYWYLVNSTFEYFPGLPIHRSRDLVNWELIGHGLHRPAQVSGAVNLVDVQSDGGIHAPSIRCGDGKFFVITTNVYLPDEPGAQAEMVNFVITADDPAGPWSDPHVIEGAPGIDPDLFFDQDGRAWYLGNHAPRDPNFPGEGEIWLQELDPNDWSLKGERHLLWRGACGGTWAEGPHLYRHDGRYYLLIAEGGTSFDHAVMVAVSENITGPYHSNPRNPVLTSRHLSYDPWVNSTGHADLFQLPDGRWYLVALGIRGDIERRSNMGRETHLVPVTWEREPWEWKQPKYLWPVASPLSGRVEKHYPLPFADTPQERLTEWADEFDNKGLDLRWNFRRLPLPGSWSLTERSGFLRLETRPGVIRERGRASLLGIRQTETAFRFETRMLFEPAAENSEAGLALFQKDDHYASFTVRHARGTHYLALTLATPETGPVVTDTAELDRYAGEILLRAAWLEGEYVFEWSPDGKSAYRELGRLPGDALLSRGYTGAYLGLYATANGSQNADFADFDRVRYSPRAGLEAADGR